MLFVKEFVMTLVFPTSIAGYVGST
uniref:Uncharacterized protein n=1 Tax=Rhizophora mucronata TaxID=61149 RepID=A0A2P2LVS4_RHIMU